MATDSAAVGRAEERIYYDQSMVDVDSGTSAAASFPPAVRQLLKQLDQEGKGYVNASTLDKFRLVRPSVAQDAGGKSARVTRFTPSVLAAFDFDGDGQIESTDLQMAMREKTIVERNFHWSRRLIFGLLVSIVMLCASMFGLSFLAVELAKETRVGDDNVVRTGSGDVALIGSSDLLVFNGTLFERTERETCTGDDDGCRRLTEASAHALVTGTAQERRALTSRIADEVFQNLDKVTLHLTEGDGINTEVTLRVHAYMRTRKAGSLCGTIVRLDMLEGTIILDDSDIHMDARMVEHFLSSGLAMGDASPYGRRLQTSTTNVMGIFSQFDDLEVRCSTEGSPKPQSPKMPYRVKMLERRPCTENATSCDSQLFQEQGLKVPGYDAASDSIVTLTESLITEDLTITWSTWPNYPGQELVTVTNNAAQTTWNYQKQDTTVNLCWNESYAPATQLSENDLHVVYLGETHRDERSIEVFGQSYTIPASLNRVFRVRSNNNTDEKWIDYEDVSSTMLPQRMFMHMAREGHFEVEEVITLDIQEMDESHADVLLEAYLGPLSCSQIQNTMEAAAFPQMMDPYHESIEAVQFIVDDLKANPESEVLLDGYWSYAVENFNASDYDEIIGDDSRRLLVKRSADGRRLWAPRKCGPKQRPSKVLYPFGTPW